MVIEVLMIIMVMTLINDIYAHIYELELQLDPTGSS